ncbi:hypothetical protein R3X25_06660 [Lutibacter sp. TH_r2]|uniref:hypothetical protein n=1 Tax=Lutibacter sp. TH_r2 TaxID=3082083 RepID=UPI002953B2B0|nr:hypothetical protein [Lutibacter sp. TH_r2]MDV7186958.1 hypothetical protein [Lutibacter sp. TH_r2]
MKAAQKNIQPQNQPHFKVIKNSPQNRSEVYINTLAPNFSYLNEKGDEIIKNNCIKL